MKRFFLTFWITLALAVSTNSSVLCFCEDHFQVDEEISCHNSQETEQKSKSHHQKSDKKSERELSNSDCAFCHHSVKSFTAIDLKSSKNKKENKVAKEQVTFDVQPTEIFQSVGQTKILYVLTPYKKPDLQLNAPRPPPISA